MLYFALFRGNKVSSIPEGEEKDWSTHSCSHTSKYFITTDECSGISERLWGIVNSAAFLKTLSFGPSLMTSLRTDSPKPRLIGGTEEGSNRLRWISESSVTAFCGSANLIPVMYN